MKARLMLFLSLSLGMLGSATAVHAHCQGTGGPLHPAESFAITAVVFGLDAPAAVVGGACGHEFAFSAVTLGEGSWVLRNGSTGATWKTGTSPHVGVTPPVPFSVLVLQVTRTSGLQSTPVGAALKALR